MRSVKRKIGGLAAATMAIFLATSLVILIAGCGSSDTGGGGGGGGEEAAGTQIDAGLPDIALLAPAIDGAGEVPTFEWKAVDGATRYRLVVLDGSGSMLWAWNGSETKVNLGGLPGDRPEGAGGPVIDTDSSWSVVAFDDNGSPLAVSEIRPVSP